MDKKNKPEIEILPIIKNYIQLTKKGQNYWGICPFHNDTSPSLSVSPSRNYYKCFACNNAGDGIKFVMEFKKCSRYEAIKEIEELLNIKMSNDSLAHFDEHKLKLFNLTKIAKDAYEGFLFRDENQEQLNYLLARKISLKQIKKFNLGYAPNKLTQLYEIAINKNNIRGILDEKEIYNLEDLTLTKLVKVSDNGEITDFFINRIMIPIFDEFNNTIAFSGRAASADQMPKYINSPTSDLFKKEEILYNMNNLNPQQKSCYLVEGFMDLYALDAIGKENVLATMGTAFSTHHLIWLKQKGMKEIILCFDNDSAGLEASIKTGLKIQKQLDVFVIDNKQFQEKDFNELLQADKKDELIKITNNLLHFSIFYLNYILQNAQELNNLEKKQQFEKIVEFLQYYGDNFYLEQYIKIIHTTLGISQELVASTLKSKLNTINHKSTPTTYIETKNKKKYITNLEKIINNIIDKQDNLLIYAMQNKELFEQIARQYTFNNEFGQYDDWLNIIATFYIENEEYNSVFENWTLFTNHFRNQPNIVAKFNNLLYKRKNILSYSTNDIVAIIEFLKIQIQKIKLLNLFK